MVRQKEHVGAREWYAWVTRAACCLKGDVRERSAMGTNDDRQI